MTIRAHAMAVARDPNTGAALLSATVNVYNPGTTTPISATMFDRNGNTLTNPLTSDASTGLIDFYVTVAQEVDLNVVKAGYTTRTYSNVPVIDDASYELSAVMTTTGDIVYASSNNVPARLGIGSAGSFLTVASGIPSWSNTISAGGLMITAGGEMITAGNLGIGVSQAANILCGLFGTTAEQYGVVQNGTLQSSGGTAAAFNNNGTIQAGADSANLYGLLIQPTFSVNGHASITSRAAYLAPAVWPAGATNETLRLGQPANATNNYYLVMESGWLFTAAGDVIPQNGATNMTAGFAYIPGAAGIPTGTPAANAAGRAPLFWDDTDRKLWAYSNSQSTWRDITQGWQFQTNGDFFSNTAGATNAVAGFAYIPAAAGAPTNTPTNNGAGRAPLYFDTTNSKLWVYDNAVSNWRGVVVA